MWNFVLQALGAAAGGAAQGGGGGTSGDKVRPLLDHSSANLSNMMGPIPAPSQTASSTVPMTRGVNGPQVDIGQLISTMSNKQDEDRFQNAFKQVLSSQTGLDLSNLF